MKFRRLFVWRYGEICILTVKHVGISTFSKQRHEEIKFTLEKQIKFPGYKHDGGIHNKY